MFADGYVAFAIQRGRESPSSLLYAPLAPLNVANNQQESVCRQTFSRSIDFKASALLLASDTIRAIAPLFSRSQRSTRSVENNKAESLVDSRKPSDWAILNDFSGYEAADRQTLEFLRIFPQVPVYKKIVMGYLSAVPTRSGV